MIIGAGAIGKGVMVPLFLRHDGNVTLVNRTPASISNPDVQGYLIYAGENVQQVQGFQYCGFHDAQFEHAFHEADVLVLTLRDEGLYNVSKQIGDKMWKRSRSGNEQKLSILVCSNQRSAIVHVTESLRRKVNQKWLDQHVEVLHVLVYIGAAKHASSPYDIDINALHGRIEMETSVYSHIHEWPEITCIRNAETRLLIKLSLINRVQLYLALMGIKKNYETMAQCLDDKELLLRAKKSYEECCHALVWEYPDDMQAVFGELLWCRVLQSGHERLERFLHDVNGKLQENERIMLPIKLAEKRHLSCDFMKEAQLLAQDYVVMMKNRRME